MQGLATPTTAVENRQVVDRLLAATERHPDAASPLVQARVLQGSARLTAASDHCIGCGAPVLCAPATLPATAA